jgi:hypothetical protein
MGHDSAWKKAANVTIIAATLPRNSKGRDRIASTTDIVEKSVLPPENGFVTGRTQDEGYAILLRTNPLLGAHPRINYARAPLAFLSLRTTFV